MNPLPIQWLMEELTRLGFLPDGDAMRLGHIVAQAEGGWLVLSAPSPGEAPAPGPTGHLAQPGLWKNVRTPDGMRRICELPAALLAAEEPDDTEGSSALKATIEWALATRDGIVPDDWLAPTPELVKPLLPAGALMIQSGGHARQGELILEPRRLALRLPILLDVPQTLAANRLAWLHEAMLDAQSRRRLVRLGIRREAGASPLIAEMDFTGAPCAALPALFLAGIDALRGVVSWLLPGADLCADVTMTPRAFEVCTPQPATNERTDP